MNLTGYKLVSGKRLGALPVITACYPGPSSQPHLSLSCAQLVCVLCAGAVCPLSMRAAETNRAIMSLPAIAHSHRPAGHWLSLPCAQELGSLLFVTQACYLPPTLRQKEPHDHIKWWNGLRRYRKCNGTRTAGHTTIFVE